MVTTEAQSRFTPSDDTLQAAMQDELDRVLDAGQHHAAGLGADYRLLWQSLREATAGGKRLRPSMLLKTYLALGGRDVDAAVRAACSVELLHTAFVLHDDVMDNDVVRRGAPNAMGTFAQVARESGASAAKSLTAGSAAGILAGDLALVAALRGLTTCSTDRTVTDTLLDLFDEAVRVSAAGQLDDVLNGACSRLDVSVDDALAMAEHKTAAYTFGLPLQLGATLAGAPEALIDRLGQIGRTFGVGFQLIDDLRGVFGKESDTGKAAIGDLREGKLTALIVHARDTSSWSRLREHIGNPDLTAQDAATVTFLLEECGSRRFVEDLAQAQLDAALVAARDAHLPTALVDELQHLTYRLIRSAA